MIFNLFFYIFKFIKNIVAKIRYLASNKYVVGGLAIAGLGLGLILSRRKK